MAKRTHFEIRHLDPGEYDLWDHFIMQSNSASLYTSLTWANIIKSVFNRTFKILVAINNENEIHGGVVYWPQKKSGLNVISLAPVTPYQGILISNNFADSISKRNEITEQLIKYLQNKFDYIDFILAPEIQDIRPYQWQKFDIETKYTYRFKLTAPENLLEQFNSNLKRKVKKFSESGLQAEYASNIEPMLDFIISSYERNNLKPPVGKTELKRVFQQLIENELAKIVYIKDKENIVAGKIVTFDPNYVYSYFVGMTDAFRSSYNVEYLFDTILTLPEFQNKTFDFLGANTPELEPFKRSFGGDLVNYYHVTWYKNRSIKFLSNIRKQQHLLSRKTHRAN